MLPEPELLSPLALPYSALKWAFTVPNQALAGSKHLFQVPLQVLLQTALQMAFQDGAPPPGRRATSGTVTSVEKHHRISKVVSAQNCGDDVR